MNARTNAAAASALPMPFEDVRLWSSVQALQNPPAIDSLGELYRRMSSYCGLHGSQGGLAGLKAALEDFGKERFFHQTLPGIVCQALQLPALYAKHVEESGPLRIMVAGKKARQVIPRPLCVSLVANMFLCTFDNKAFGSLFQEHDMCDPSFTRLLANRASSEVAKLHMFLHFFDRNAGAEPLQGKLVIDRVVGVALTEEEWLSSTAPLLPVHMAAERVGFETAPGLAHADFANMYIGGGVLQGGCVQEEIRFSICPELLVSMLLCPCMENEEAIQIVGAEQFSKYDGYMFSLRFGGDHMEEADRLPDGTPQTAVLAMDALDLRSLDDSLHGQMSPPSMLRELNKSLAAFTPVDQESLKNFPVVATGNWGCGAFGGFAPLKALIQWASASQCGRKLSYFPFEQAFGPWLEELAEVSIQRGATVGQLLTKLWALRPPPRNFELHLPRHGRGSSAEDPASDSRQDAELTDDELGSDLNKYPFRLMPLVSAGMLTTAEESPGLGA